MTFDARKIVTLVMLGLFTGALVMAYSLPPKAAFMPYLVGIPGALLCLLQLIIDLKHGFQAKSADESETAEETSTGATEGQMFLWVLIFTATIIGFGFEYGGPIVVALFVRFSSKESWLNTLFAGGGTYAVLFGIFVWLLELQLFQGLIIEAVF